MSRRKGTFSLLVVSSMALVARIGACWWGAGRVPPTADGAFYHVVAQRIAGGEGYTWLWPDGVVTPAAHYPVGYPALVGALYGAFGAHPWLAMLLNASIGTAGVAAVFILSRRFLLDFGHSPLSADRSARVLGLLLSLAPTLVMYTPALMTESNVGALCAVAFALGDWARRRAVGQSEHAGNSWPSIKAAGALLAAGLLLGTATLMRPQTVLLAPLLGWFSVPSWRRAWAGAAIVTCVCFAVVLPWTQRNCERMERCVFVSANGGWNLLIGTFPEGKGSWVELSGERVPPRCRHVYQEAEKDRCFGDAAVSRIVDAPATWLRLIPAKLRATFEYSAAAEPHLQEAGALSGVAGAWLRSLEYAHQRLLSLLALTGAWWAARQRAGKRSPWVLVGIALVGALGFLGGSAPVGWAVFVGLCFFGGRVIWSPAGFFAWGTLASTAAVYAVFFGAGRYGLPVWYAIGPFAALGFWSWGEVLRPLFDRQRLSRR